MRNIVLSMSISLDGYIQGPHGQIDWHRVDDELHSYFNAQLRPMGAFLSGRVTHELMASFWPTADADPAVGGPVAEFAEIWREKPKIVFSRTLQKADWNTAIIRDVVPDDILALKAQPGGDLAVGGADLAAAFMQHNLIDEYCIYVHPVLIGQGKPLFPSTEAMIDLELAESRTFRNGVVMLRYHRDVATLA
jgi:dihydrofolate reductase